jgi:hypothetical protein
MQPPPLEDEQINQFHRDGYLIVKDCIAPDDIARIRHIAERDAQLQADAHYNHNHEGDGLGTRLVYRNQLAVLDGAPGRNGGTHIARAASYKTYALPPNVA